MTVYIKCMHADDFLAQCYCVLRFAQVNLMSCAQQWVIFVEDMYEVF